jgi:intermediate cleaving peptidase 55
MNRLYPHHVGHYIGLDVHDCPSVPRSIAFSEGMAITVEPGIYIPNEEKYGDFKGIGIRIEDDVCISKDGPIVLTAEAPKEIVDIEHVMRK